MTNSKLPVIIIGTGPSALLFAQALLRASPSIPFRLFEKDLSISHRAQGYRFRVTGRGVASCQDVLTPEHFALLRASCADNQTAGMKRIDGPTGEELPGGMTAKNIAKDDALTAERTLMRKVLFRGLEKFATFGKQMVSYEEVDEPKGSDLGSGGSDTSSSAASNDSGSIIVRFADGTSEHGSLLVGADGAFSKVRSQLLPETKLLDSSMRMAFGRTSLTPEVRERIGADSYDDLVTGTKLINSPSKMFFMCESMRFGQRETAKTMDPNIGAEMPSDYMYWALALRSEQPEAQGINWRALSADDTADMTLKLTGNWQPSLRALLANQDRTQTMPLFSGVMPLPLARWRHSADDGDNSLPAAITGPFVTLIGDAAHAMPPTAGVGATTALTDAAILGAALAKHGITQQALDEYETEMREYASKAIESGLKNGKFFLPGLRDMADMEPMERERASARQW